MFLAAIVKAHTDTERPDEYPSANASAPLLQVDQTWPSFKPRLPHAPQGRATPTAEASRTRWT